VEAGEGLTSRDVLNWFVENWKVWFDGLGVMLLAALGSWLIHRRREKKALRSTADAAASPTLSTVTAISGPVVGNQNVGSGIAAHTVNFNLPAPSADAAQHLPPRNEEQKRIALDAWEKLQAVVGEAGRLTSIMQMRPDFWHGARDDVHDRKALDGEGLTEEEIAFVLGNGDANARSRAFVWIHDRKAVRSIDSDTQAFFNFVIKNQPLLSEVVAEALLDKGKALRIALIPIRLALEEQMGLYNLESERRESDEEVRALQGVGMKALERLLRSQFS
jgi:hypothetical protein